MTHYVQVLHGAFDPWAELKRFDAELPRGQCGAQVTFVGTLRDFSDVGAVQSMVLEHYPGMTERYIERICADAVVRWGLEYVVVVHRVGALDIGDPIVLVAIWSAHRAAAFDACRYVINELKNTAPFWKRETVNTGALWVTHNTADEQAAKNPDS